MKKVLCLILILSLVFGSVLPVYAEAWTSQQASTVTSGTTGILSMLTQLRTDFVSFWQLSSSTVSGSYWTFQDLCNMVGHINDWFAPLGARGNNDPTLMDGIVVLTNYAMNNLPYIPTIASYVGSWMTSNNNYLNTLVSRSVNLSGTLFPMKAEADGAIAYDTTTASTNAFSTIINRLYWLDWEIAHNNNISVRYFNDQLSIWDSQGNTLSQELWTPKSAINGLYKYFAYTQRDVARLAHVYASDEEIATRDKAKANQSEVMNDFIDPNGSGSVSTTDIGNMAGYSSGFKSNFNTGVSGSGIWDAFNSNHYSWFSQATKDSLDTTVQTRGSEDYPTPLLDQYYEDIMSYFTGDNDDQSR